MSNIYEKLYDRITRLKKANINPKDYILKVTHEELAEIKSNIQCQFNYNFTPFGFNDIDGYVFGMPIKAVRDGTN